MRNGVPTATWKFPSTRGPHQTAPQQLRMITQGGGRANEGAVTQGLTRNIIHRPRRLGSVSTALCALLPVEIEKLSS